MQGMFAQQQKLLKLFQAKPELVESMQAFVTLLKDNGAFCISVRGCGVQL